MKKQHHTVNQTFSLPTHISLDLHAFVKPRERSRFVSEAIRKELEIKKDELRKCYLLANKDPGQKEAAEWSSTLADGLYAQSVEGYR